MLKFPTWVRGPERRRRLANALAAPARAQVQRLVRGVFPRDEPPATHDGHEGRAGPASVDYDAPAGDPGLFGPDSAIWRIHADFPGMMAGGLCALMLQTLHPLALAGVWDHSNFRHDLIGRLRRTTTFVAATTYAPAADARRLIENVRRIHTYVHGHAQDGRPYRADDPDLLTWVHTTETSSFLRGYLRYVDPALPGIRQDRYYAEAARIAIALGARNVPVSRTQVDAYFRSVQPALAFTERSAEVLRVLAGIRLPIPAAVLGRELFLGAGAVLLPAWARARIPRSRAARVRDAVAARALRLAAPTIRSAMTDGIAPRACHRVGVAPDALQRWP